MPLPYYNPQSPLSIPHTSVHNQDIIPRCYSCSMVLKSPFILYMDDFIVIAHKPVNMLSVPGRYNQPSLLHYIFKNYPPLDNCAMDKMVIHRLDYKTSGLLVFSRSIDVTKKYMLHFDHAVCQKSIMHYYVDISHLISNME